MTAGDELLRWAYAASLASGIVLDGALGALLVAFVVTAWRVTGRAAGRPDTPCIGTSHARPRPSTALPWVRGS